MLTLIICIGYLPNDGTTETKGVGMLMCLGCMQNIRGCVGVFWGVRMTAPHGLLTNLKFVPPTAVVGGRGGAAVLVEIRSDDRGGSWLSVT